MNSPPSAPGRVYIVGAGPGDPGLLTIKGAGYLRSADVVFYDDLLDTRLLDLTNAACDRVYVGHRGGTGSRTQEDVNELLITHAREGKRVVRLKGGDPYVFGRGSEEALALKAAGIPFEVVSGISAALAVPAYTGIPLTHRHMAAMAVLVTGHEDPFKSTPTVDWGKLAKLDATLVIFMGNRNLPDITTALIEGGRAPETPAAAIEWGTWPHQNTVVSRLDSIAGDVRLREMKSPTLAIVGEVVSLCEQLNWFEGKPLFRRRILVTRSREQAAPLQLLLEAEGAEVVSLPLLEIRPPRDWTAVDEAISHLANFDWTVFTSPNSVDFLFQRLAEAGCDSRAFGTCAIAAVGISTAERLAARGINPDLVPDNQSQEGLATAFEDLPVDGQRFLVPASSIGRTLLDEKLEARGAEISRVVAYQNEPPDPAGVVLPEALAEGHIDLFVFASPSSVRNFCELLGSERAVEVLSTGKIASIGPTTTLAVEECGRPVDIQPQESSIPHLVEAICRFHESGEDGVR
jgi:uroporphyrinogen III methyltransferase/synthase